MGQTETERGWQQTVPETRSWEQAGAEKSATPGQQSHNPAPNDHEARIGNTVPVGH